MPSGAGWQTAGTTVTLRAGLNTVSYQRDATDSGDVAIDRLTVAGGVALAGRGATLPYTEYEAESGATNGTVLAADRTYRTLASESSGRRAVQLTATGSYVQIVLAKPANALTVRYSIPDTGSDATLSLYANGTPIRDLALPSRYAWVYGDYPYNNDPATGNAHRFYDESRTLIGDWPAGTVLKLQKDAGDTAASYTVDLIDAEQTTALAAPAGFRSAPAPSGGDDTPALTAAIRRRQGRGPGPVHPGRHLPDRRPDQCAGRDHPRRRSVVHPAQGHRGQGRLLRHRRYRPDRRPRGLRRQHLPQRQR